jgi:GDP-L-fucose synthase
LDGSSLARLGWKAKISLQQGIKETYASFLAEEAAGQLRA